MTPLKVDSNRSAIFYAALGEKDKAVVELEKSYENHDFSIVWIKVDPCLDPLRDEPRFQDLLQRIELSH